MATGTLICAPRAGSIRTVRDHRHIDQRSLEFDRLVAVKLSADSSLRDRAVRNVERWLATASPAAQAVLLEWQGILRGPMSDLLELLVSSDERAVRLRQSSPFTGMFTVAERAAVLKDFQQRESNPA